VTPEVAAALLDIHVDATPEQIRRAFRLRARLRHPDSQSGASDADRSAAGETFGRIVQAKDLLLTRLESRTASFEEPTFGDWPRSRPSQSSTPPKPSTQAGSWVGNPAFGAGEPPRAKTSPTAASASASESGTNTFDEPLSGPWPRAGSPMTTGSAWTSSRPKRPRGLVLALVSVALVVFALATAQRWTKVDIPAHAETFHTEQFLTGEYNVSA